MNQCRIPELKETTANGIESWFCEMSEKDLLFHPDDSPSDIFRIATGEKTFTNQECQKLDVILESMFKTIGDDVYEISLPVFLKRLGIELDD